MNDFNRGGKDREADRPSADPRQLVRRPRELVKDEPEKIVALRHERNLRTGEAAAELRSQQYHYPFDVQSKAAQALSDELVAARAPFSDRAEEFRALRGTLLGSVFSGIGKRALAVVSAEEGEGKTYLAANLAISFSQFAGRALLIDGNLRRPRLHWLFGLKSEVGLSNLLAGEVQRETVVPVEGAQGLHFLAAGSAMADPVQLLQGARFSVLLEQLTETFDYVLIDTPANSIGPDARVIAARAGATLVVGRQAHSRVSRLKQLLSQLNMGPSVVAGVVLNRH